MNSPAVRHDCGTCSSLHRVRLSSGGFAPTCLFVTLAPRKAEEMGVNAWLRKDDRFQSHEGPDPGDCPGHEDRRALAALVRCGLDAEEPADPRDAEIARLRARVEAADDLARRAQVCAAEHEAAPERSLPGYLDIALARLETALAAYRALPTGTSP